MVVLYHPLIIIISNTISVGTRQCRVPTIYLPVISGRHDRASLRTRQCRVPTSYFWETMESSPGAIVAFFCNNYESQKPRYYRKKNENKPPEKKGFSGGLFLPIY
jgi:hypothetical protein